VDRQSLFFVVMEPAQGCSFIESPIATVNLARRGQADRSSDDAWVRNPAPVTNKTAQEG
jgi:hypothetical protein